MASKEPSENSFSLARQHKRKRGAAAHPQGQQGCRPLPLAHEHTALTLLLRLQSKQLKARKWEPPRTLWGGFLWLLLPWKYFFVVGSI